MIMGLVVATDAATGPGSVPLAPESLSTWEAYNLHVNCTGKGSPTVVVENGLGDFSFDWMLVQSKVSAFTRTIWSWRHPMTLRPRFAR
jgi:hypothetical protein